jgi:hypothetical protein
MSTNVTGREIALGLSVLCGSILTLAEASAQILPPLPLPGQDNTPPQVAVTSPANGAVVSGTITITANASDNKAVAGVQFKYNGNNIGAEDTTAPYSVTGDTRTVPDGSYTLTAVARDAAGNRTTSSPVTITIANNGPPPPPSPGRYEETDPSVTFSAGWMQTSLQQSDWSGWSGGSAMWSAVPGAQATFTFTGTSATWIGYRSVDSGIPQVFVDGAYVGDVNLFALNDEVSTRAYSVVGLANARHTLTIEVTANKYPTSTSNKVVVDAFEVPARAVSHVQETDPDVSFTGSWTQRDTSKPWSATYAAVSSAAGSRATFAFNGTAISWIGYLGNDTGIARVYIDGGLAGQVDTYVAGSPIIQKTLFSATGLADSSHTIAIEVTGGKNAASTGTSVVVDAFDVTRPGTRYQEESPAVVYSGNWIHGNLNRTWSEGTISESATPGSRATFTFNGTQVSWIGCQKNTTGIANVYVDGNLVSQIDTFRAQPIEGYQDVVYTASGLAPGPHTMTIEATGLKNPAADNNYIVIDAFDVRP